VRVAKRLLCINAYMFFHTRTIARDDLADKGKVWGHLVPEIGGEIWIVTSWLGQLNSTKDRVARLVTRRIRMRGF
jgi:hypothetical protein